MQFLPGVVYASASHVDTENYAVIVRRERQSDESRSGAVSSLPSAAERSDPSPQVARATVTEPNKGRFSTLAFALYYNLKKTLTKTFDSRIYTGTPPPRKGNPVAPL